MKFFDAFLKADEKIQDELDKNYAGTVSVVLAVKNGTCLGGKAVFTRNKPAPAGMRKSEVTEHAIS